MNKEKEIVYFPGLNGIRAIAALLVIFMHFNQFAYLFGLSRFYPETDLAGIAVTIFFALSGFLITFLLLEEKEKYESVSLSKFYMRRILRIWPLYFTIIIASFLLYHFVPSVNEPVDTRKTIFLFIFFLPNYAYLSGLTITPITPLWSIGVEEQFYILWPWFFRGKKTIQRLGTILLCFLLLFLAVKLVVRVYGSTFWFTFISTTRLDCMALGGIGAYLYKTKRQGFLKIMYHPLTQVLAWLVLLVTIAYRPIHFASFFDHDFYALVSLALILNVSTNKKTLISLENGICNFLGKISYGLYCYHMLIIVILSLLLPSMKSHDVVPVQVGMFVFVLLVTIIVAGTSYHLFEIRFINLKHRFAKIFSSNSMLSKSAGN